MLFNTSILTSLSGNRELWEPVSRSLKSSRPLAKVSIFLSHSHADKELVKGFIIMLAASGIELYVDWRDSGMPVSTNAQTVDRIRDQIGANDLFMVLATDNALKSRWVPWEIGVADQMKGYDKMFIVPVADDSGSFEGSEFLQVYRRIEISEANNIAHFEPNTTDGFTVKSLLQQYAR